MVQPIDYGVDIPDPAQAFLGAFKTGAAIQEVGLRQQQQQQEITKREQELAQQRNIQSAFAKIKEPGATADDVANLAMILPKDQSEAVLKGWALKSDTQKSNALRQSGRVVSALFAGEPDLAMQDLETQRQARLAAGDQEGAKFLETWRDITGINPKASQDFFTAELLQLPGGETIVKNIISLQGERRAAEIAPSQLAEQQAKANEAATKAKFAESKAVADLNLTDAQINNYAVQQDTAKQNARIAAMQAQAAQEGNVLKRQELQLKIETAQEARDQSVRDKYSQAQNVLATFDNTLVSVDKILNNWGKTKDGKIDPNLSNSTVKSATGPVQSRIFTTRQDVADFEEQVGSLESQAFLSQVEKMRGLGALTEKEGARLVNALASLSLRQSPKQLAENLLVVRDLMQKARSSAEGKYGALQSEPTTPATPTAAGGLTPEEQAELNRLRQRFPGGR